MIPANSSGLALEALFGNDLSVDDYGISWVVYFYDGENGVYARPTLSESLPAGQGFWIIQATGVDVDVALPATLEPVESDPSLACIDSAQCVQIPLFSSDALVSWTQAGIPVGQTSMPSEFLFTNGAQGLPCSDGCSLEDAIDSEQIAGPLWLYDSDLGAYSNAMDTDLVGQGQGFWFGTLPAAANSVPALHVPGIPGLCTYYVSTDGNDSNAGRTEALPFESIDAGVSVLMAGDTLCLMSGIYQAPLMIADKMGTQAQPIVVRALPGDEGQVSIRDGVGSMQTGISVSNSSHIHVMNLDIRFVLRGIQFNSVTGGEISGNTVVDIEQEAIRVGALTDSAGLSGGASTQISIQGNSISKTGRRMGSNSAGTDYSDFGEGIYVGTGKYVGDDTHDIIVSNNVISHTTAEAIEVKPYTYNIKVRNNTITAVTLPYSGAISVAIGPVANRDGNYLIEDNRVYQVTSRQHSVAGIVVGQGNAVIRNNTIWDIDGGRGIRVYTTFVLPSANMVTIEGNTLWNPDTARSIAIDDGNGGFNLDERALVFTSGNITDDGSADSQPVTEAFFVGPISDDADHGDGAGSGFDIK